VLAGVAISDPVQAWFSLDLANFAGAPEAAALRDDITRTMTDNPPVGVRGR